MNKAFSKLRLYKGEYMKTLNFKNTLFFLIASFLILLLACGKSPEDARKELGQMNIEYSEASFLKCSERGDILAVKLFLASGMGPNIKDKDGMTPLMKAASNGCFFFIRKRCKCKC
jgi:hypothetical protein